MSALGLHFQWIHRASNIVVLAQTMQAQFSVATSFFQEMTKLESNFQWTAPASPDSTRNRPKGHLLLTIAAADCTSTFLNFRKNLEELLSLEFEHALDPLRCINDSCALLISRNRTCSARFCRHQGEAPAPAVCMPI